MIRWIAALGAALLLPACGDGPGGQSAPEAAGQAPAAVGTGQPPSVRIISPESGAARSEGSKITIKAVVTDPDAVVVRVDFYDDNRLIGSRSKTPYTITYERLKAGTHELCAVAIDVDGNPTASPPVTLFVVRGDGDHKDDD
jgi:hypothetical protein